MVSKKPEFKAFRPNLIEFFNNIIHKAAEKGILYDNLSFMEDLHIWVASMSSSNLRSFRHIATLVWLTIQTKLCHLHVAASESANQNQKILDSESEKSRPNQARVKQAQSSVELASSNKKYLEIAMDDIFKTIFVHRYRDVDPKIRIDCMHELGIWMEVLPIIFFDSKYIRYFGWLLSDINSHTRTQVIKSLTALYKIRDNISEFRHFTDRFRLRIIEMAVLDADVNVRVATIELLCVLREVGFLATQDVEVCCRLVYDLDPRVRKAASKFLLAHCVEEAEGRAQSEFSSRELKTLMEVFSGVNNAWLIFKELCFIIKAEQDENTIKPPDSDRVLEDLEDLYPNYSSRISLAGEALWEAGIGNNVQWTALVSLLLFDFSSLDTKATTNTSKNFVAMFALDSVDELILLELLFGLVSGSIKELGHHHLVSASTLGNMRKKNMSSDEIEARQTEIQAELIHSIPKLLDNYAHSPDATVQILRLHSLLNLDSYRQLHMENKYNELVAVITSQFKTNTNKLVLEECVNAFSKTIQDQASLAFCEEVQSKIKDLLDDVGYDLKATLIEARDSPEEPSVEQLSELILHPVLKIDALSRSIDIQRVLELPLVSDDADAHDATILVENLRDFLKRYSVGLHKDLNLSLILSLFNLLRSYCMWKFSVVVTDAIAAATSTGTTLESVDLDSKTLKQIASIIDTFETVVECSDSIHVRSIGAKALLDLLVTVNVTVAQVSALAACSALDTSLPEIQKLSLFELPNRMSKPIEKITIGIFLKKERAYGEAVQLDLKSQDADAESLALLQPRDHLDKNNEHEAEKESGGDKDNSDSDLSDLSDAEDDHGLDDALPTASQTLMSHVLNYDNIIKITDDESRKQQKKLLLDVDLCQFTAKIRMAALANVMDINLARRVALNSKVLSSLYQRLISVDIASAGVAEPDDSRRKRGGRRKKVPGPLSDEIVDSNIRPEDEDLAGSNAITNRRKSTEPEDEDRDIDMEERDDEDKNQPENEDLESDKEEEDGSSKKGDTTDLERELDEQLDVSGDDL